MAHKQFINERTCIVCKGKESKGKLLRFVLDSQNNVVHDEKHCFEGRGAYIHNSKDCLSFLGIERIFKKAFRVPNDLKIKFDVLKHLKNNLI